MKRYHVGRATAWQNNYIITQVIIAGAGSFRSNQKSLVASTRGTNPRGNLT
jgi:hypothetical protein